MEMELWQNCTYNIIFLSVISKAEDLLSKAQENLLRFLTAESISCKMLHVMGE